MARARLVRDVGAQPVTLVHAHGGWGKSTLAVEAAGRHVGEVVWVDLRDVELAPSGLLARILDPLGLDGMVGDDVPTDLGGGTAELVTTLRTRLGRRRTPTLVVVDEITDAAWPAVLVLARGLPDHHRLLALSRRPPPDQPDGAALLDGAALAFTVEEFLLLLRDQVPAGLPSVMAEGMWAATGGWPTALRSVAAALGRATAPLELGRRLLADNVVLDALVEDLLAPLDADVVDALRRAAALPLLDRRTARQLGLVDAIAAAQEAGLPWQTPQVGPWLLPDPVRDLLVDGEPLPLPFLRDVAEVHRRHGLHLPAARLALREGHPDLAAQVLADAPAAELAEAFKPSVLALIDSLPDPARSAHPWLDVQVARLLTASARYADRNAFVEARAGAHDDPDVAAALEAERFRDLAYFAPTPDPADIARIEALLGEVTDLSTRSRLEQGLALLLARRDGVGAAEAGLRRAAEAAERAGEAGQAALVLRDLAWVVLLEQGRLRQVVETFDRVEAMLGPDTRTTSWRINRADTLLTLGELDAAEADLDVAARLAELHHDDQHVAYAAWARATLESMREAPMRTLAAVQRAEAMAGDWAGTVTGVLFAAQCADALARAGLEAEARQRLAVAEARRDEDPRAVDVAAVGVEARLGDPVRALALLDGLDMDDMEPFEVPRLMLLGALARQRAGAPAGPEAARALVAFQAQGRLDAAPHQEPTAWRVLLPLARAEGAPLPSDAGSVAAAGAGGGVGAGAAAGSGAVDLGGVLRDRYGLRPREVEAVLALQTGGTNAEIAEAMGVSVATVRKHLQHAYATLGLRSRSEALVMLTRLAS